MSEFLTYLKLGYEHITDLKGFDHILFIMALAATYTMQRWKSVVLLVTAFTVGHSITLALASMKILRINSDLVELLIPLTILVTCLFNFFHKFPRSINSITQKIEWKRYLLAIGFGLIHGMGFSNYLRSLLGKESSIVKPLFSFNLGLEIGQVMIVLAVLLWTFLMVDGFKMKHKNWNNILSGIVFGMALMLLIERF